MKVYESNADGTGKWARFSTSKDEEALDLFDGDTPFGGTRRSIRIERSASRTRKVPKLSDYSCVNHTPYPCFSEHAKQALGTDIKDLGRWLPLEFNEAPYWLFDITNLIDALDVERSKILYFPDGQKVMRIAEFAFDEARLRGQLMFKPKQRSYNLVTQDFVDLIYQHRLTGFVFKLLWSSEGGPVSSSLKDYEIPRITRL